ncbi:hypothetical protein K2173_019415 [Erythroxylum novogranatense]|uniref:RING-type E3 ubiquitin transferase n=1 Tax=Erythroxylum novogranatense TaxID=1862640 RepID=A0AAV8UE06_9ROSI|nr:hypothetical protein K2173_019415 [Erythroxylum novogranatense]
MDCEWKHCLGNVHKYRRQGSTIETMSSLAFICLLLYLLASICSTNGEQLIIVNNCNESIWPGLLGSAGGPTPKDGGFHLASGEEVVIDLPQKWSGRIWGRQGCCFDANGKGSCDTGDCSGFLHCQGIGGVPPATVVEMTLGSSSSPLHFYDVSLVDGFNLPVSMAPVGGGIGCGVASCEFDLNICCPSALEVKKDGKIVGCKSACLAMQSAKYCCTGEYANPNTCKPTVFANLFKAICPKAYSYAFDDSSSLNKCRASRCNHIIRIRVRPGQISILCPDCGGGFVREIGTTPSRSPIHESFPSAGIYIGDNPNPGRVTTPRFRRTRRGGAADDRSSFNPVIVLRGPPDGGGDANDLTSSNFELYYDDGARSGLQPLPPSVSDLLMNSGFDRLLDQLNQLEIDGIDRFENPAASKAAIESMPVIKIISSHVSMESHCAVCTEKFELDTEAREMPCKHIYHSDCILPWLSIRNSCPVCRYELPSDVRGSERNSPESDEEAVGLTIWRLPGGGFAVGRFTGGRRAVERELPVVYTEMDGGFNSNGLPRRIQWAPSGRSSRERRGFRGVFNSFFSFFGRIGRRRLNSGVGRSSRRPVETRVIDDNRW